VPERVAQVEKTALSADVFALFEGTLPVCGAVKAAGKGFHFTAAVQSTFLVKALVFIGFHGDFLPVETVFSTIILLFSFQLVDKVVQALDFPLPAVNLLQQPPAVAGETAQAVPQLLPLQLAENLLRRCLVAACVQQVLTYGFPIGCDVHAVPPLCG
jgi:hypothetical protein